MARTRSDVFRDKIRRAKAKDESLQAMLEQHRRFTRDLLLTAYEAGLTQTDLALEWGTSQSRMRERLTRAKVEKGG
jgi:DNA-directed RNA polymerase specialized sigma24 family protein